MRSNKDVSQLPPRRPGFYLFSGRRTIKDGMFESLTEPLQIEEYANGSQTELVVRMFGRIKRFHPENFVGNWELLSLKEK